MVSVAEEELALMRLQPASSPQMKLSTSLAKASRDEFVYIGRRGDVRSPARYRAQRAAGIGIAALAALAGVGLSFALGVPWLSLLYLGTLGYGGNVWRLSEQLKQGAALLAAERLDEAEAVLVPLTRSRLVSSPVRALAWQNLAGVAVRRGRHAEALDHVRHCAAIFRLTWWSPAGPWRWINRFSELQLLAQLGRIDEARKILDELDGAPDGEYFQVLRMNAELMLAFAEGRPSDLPSDLHPWVRRALETTTAELALSLLAWAHEQRGDDDMAKHLLGEAFDRIDRDLFSRVYPNVYEWLRTRSETFERA